jgi:hypothetical protein
VGITPAAAPRPHGERAARRREGGATRRPDTAPFRGTPAGAGRDASGRAAPGTAPCRQGSPRKALRHWGFGLQARRRRLSVWLGCETISRRVCQATQVAPSVFPAHGMAGLSKRRVPSLLCPRWGSRHVRWRRKLRVGGFPPRRPEK